MRRASGSARKPSRVSQQYGAQSRKSIQISKPSPVGGWNKRDSIAAMPEIDAVIMDNFWPETDGVSIRPGWESFATGFSDEVESLMVYNSADGTQEMYAAAGTAFYDASSAGAIGAAVVSGLTNARWNYVNMTNSSAVSYLCAFNGVDSPRYWNGSSWITITAVSTPAITGVTRTSLKNPWIHKRRLWMVERGTLSAWYLPVDSVGGAAVEFPLYGLFKRGGSLLVGGTWTLDGGEGLDDYQVFVTTEGEVAVYTGVNPASDFTIQGVWYIGEPIGDRCLFKVGGDLMIITKRGVYPLSLALQSSQVNTSSAITDKISSEMSASARTYGSNFGWELQLLPERNMMILNVPLVENTTQYQYATNTITGAWCRFTDIQSNCWGLYNGKLYFGSGSLIGKFGDSASDNGGVINGDLLPSFSYMADEVRSNLKKFNLVRPLILSNGSPSILAALNVDFTTDTPSAPLNFTPQSVFTWDVSIWDEAFWGGGEEILKSWQTFGAVGTCASFRLIAAVGGFTLKLQAYDYVFEVGEIL
jgi:hypothetical protein